MWNCFRSHRLSLLVAAPAWLMSLGCAETSAACGGERPALGTCTTVGLFHADCGGSDGPVLACDRATGNCRWFTGGCVAAGHEASECPTEDICCHPSGFGTPDSGWPFEVWRPTDPALLRRVQEQLPLLGAVVIDARTPVPLPVTEDPSFPAPLTPSLACDPLATGVELCAAPDAVGPLRTEVIGDSLVFWVESAWAPQQLVIEVAPMEDGALGARVFVLYRQSPEGSRVATCVSSGAHAPAQTGVLVVNRFLLDAPAAVHGEFRGTIRGGDIVIRF